MEHLKSNFKSEELELAAAIGAQQGELKDKILELFRQLPDPLLTAQDIVDLLHVGDKQETILETLGVLCNEKALERTEKTQRPLDTENVVLYRLAGVAFTRLKLVGIESRLSDNSSRLQFTCDGRLIRNLARIDRLDTLSGTGNQRATILTHVKEIANGIRTGTQVPNSVLLVLDSTHIASAEDEAPESFIVIRPLVEDYVRITAPGSESQIIQEFRTVEIDFPYRRAAFDEEKSATLVDGQQRTAALSLVDVDQVPSFALSVNATIADAEQAKTIFMVANSTVKIETQFSRALLASMDQSPGYLIGERPRALAAKILSLDDKTSPFYGLVQYPGIKTPKRPPVAYNSLFQILTIFATSGLPFNQDHELLARVTARGFNLVKSTWPLAWGLKPNESKLMHGVGLRSIASLIVQKLEAQYTNHGNLDSAELWSAIELSLKRLQPHLIWRVADTENALKGSVKIYTEQIAPRQNTNQDISALTSFIKMKSLELDTEAKSTEAKSKKA